MEHRRLWWRNFIDRWQTRLTLQEIDRRFGNERLIRVKIVQRRAVGIGGLRVMVSVGIRRCVISFVMIVETIDRLRLVVVVVGGVA